MIAPEAALPYFYRLAPPTGHHELAALELQALTGAPAPSMARVGASGDIDRIAWARVGVDVARSSYVAECCRLLASAPDLGGLLGAARKLHLRMERFRVRVRKRGVAAPATREIERMVADLIEGGPDLTRPARELVVLAAPGRWLLGESVSRGANRWQGHEQRPHQYSSALPPRIARALVNLVAVPGDTLIDPCCGVGTVLVEAAEMGVQAVGCEINPRLVEHAAANLGHHGLSAHLAVADGRDLSGRFDGAVVDLPYGHTSVRVEGVGDALVARAVAIARLVAIVAADDLTGLLADLGADLLGVAAIAKGSLVRRVHWARGRGGEL